MFAEPTLDDFTRRLRWHLAREKNDCSNAINAVVRKFAAAGRHGSGSCAINTLTAVETGLDKAAETILGELTRALRTTQLAKASLREEAEKTLRAFLFEAKALFRPHQVDSTAITQRVLLLDDRLRFLLRQFDIGFSQPHETEAPPTLANSVNIGVMSGGTFQQGAENTITNTSVTINLPLAPSNPG